MQQLGMPDLAPMAARVIHFTGYEIPVEQIQVPGADVPPHRQHARHRRHHRADGRPLLPGEVPRPAVSGVRARRAGVRRHIKRRPRGVRFSSAEDLMRKTPALLHRGRSPPHRAARLRLRLRAHALPRPEPVPRRSSRRMSAMPSASRDERRHGGAAAPPPPPRSGSEGLERSASSARWGDHGRWSTP